MTRVAASPVVLLLVAATACGESDRPPEGDDPVWVDETLSAGERVFWPGVDTADGRVIPLIGGFGQGRPTSYWFVGFGTRETTDSFFFCREGDEGCPLDEHRRLSWDRFVGAPLLSRVPGDPLYSDFWQIWTVLVGPDFEPDSVRTVGELFDAVGREDVAVVREIVDFGTVDGVDIGPRDAVVHFPVVLRGTTLEGNGGPMRDGSGNRLRLESHVAWRQGLRTELIDFSPSEGVYPAADDSTHRPRMPSANIYIFWRDCEADPTAAICAIPGAHTDRRPVSERGLGQDLNGDGDVNDTNNVLGSLPCDRTPETSEPPYSPLWAVNVVDILPGAGMSLFDVTRDQADSDIRSASELRAAIDGGTLAEPRPETAVEAGAPRADGSDQALFNCPTPVPQGFVPYPCGM